MTIQNNQIHADNYFDFGRLLKLYIWYATSIGGGLLCKSVNKHLLHVYEC